MDTGMRFSFSIRPLRFNTIPRSQTEATVDFFSLCLSPQTAIGPFSRRHSATVSRSPSCKYLHLRPALEDVPQWLPGVRAGDLQLISLVDPVADPVQVPGLVGDPAEDPGTGAARLR